MIADYEKMEKAKNLLQKIAKGVDPLTGELIAEDSFLNDPRIIRCFYYVSEVLENVIQGAYSKSSGKNADFIITAEQKSRVVFSEGKIGVNEFSRCINQCIDASRSKKMTGVGLNKRLKKLGLLSEVETNDGKTRTVTNEQSAQYGIETEKRTFKGVEYDAVVINDQGKKYLLEHIEDIMKIDPAVDAELTA
ncbi:MAG: hypothetical protein N2484_16425 [Clostridia bacterium]|nr:hypothetical protein [Clostridia bacterium]